MMNPKESWVAKWQAIGPPRPPALYYVPGCYALRVRGALGTLPWDGAHAQDQSL